MPLLELLVLLLVAGVCGAIGQLIAGSTRRGWVVSVTLGIIGALLGAWMQRRLELPELVPVTIGGMTFPILWSILGAVLFVALLGLIARRRAGRPA